MERQEILRRLQCRAQTLRDTYGVESLALFGSGSRDELGETSDVDLLVRFRGAATFRGYFSLKSYLEEVLGREVDLATDKMITPRLRKRIADELIDVA